MKPLFTEKVQISSSITVVENENMITNGSEISEIFYESFTNIVQTMEIALGKCTLVPTDHLLDPVEFSA